MAKNHHSTVTCFKPGILICQGIKVTRTLNRKGKKGVKATTLVRSDDQKEKTKKQGEMGVSSSVVEGGVLA